MTKGKHGTGQWGCDGCNHPAWDFSLVGGIDPEYLQRFMAFCCGCIPSYIAVGADWGTDQSIKLFGRPCAVVDGTNRIWAGDILICDRLVDIQFSFEVTDDKRCFLCLSSSGLGVYGVVPTDCHEITAEQRAYPTRICERLLIDLGSGPEVIKWTVVTDFCGTVEITIANPNLSPIYPRFSPCVDANGYLVVDDDPIRNLCGGCSCICTCACMILIYGDGTAEAVPVCRDGTVWNAYGTTVELQKDYDTGCCKLVLTDTGNVAAPYGGLDGQEVFIGTANEANQCPLPRAKFAWSGPGPDAEPTGVLWYCAIDGPECLLVEVVGCTDMGPRVLTAVIDGAPDCDCGSMTVNLVYDDDLQSWVLYHPTLFCGGEIRLTLVCAGGGTWQMTFEQTICTGGSDTASTGTPIHLVFSFTMSGIGCCNNLDPLDPPRTITITVTE
jgi:hypothetical protein